MGTGPLCTFTTPTTTWWSCAITKPGETWLKAGCPDAKRRTLRRCQVAQVEGSALVAQAIRREGIEVLFGLAGGPGHYGLCPALWCPPHWRASRTSGNLCRGRLWIC